MKNLAIMAGFNTI